MDRAARGCLRRAGAIAGAVAATAGAALLLTSEWSSEGRAEPAPSTPSRGAEHASHATGEGAMMPAPLIAPATSAPAAGRLQGPAAGGKGVFQAVCDFSHRAPDDPIVFPGQPGASHSHDFFGSRTTDAFSTPESIRNSATTCIRYNGADKRADRSAYWTPTLLRRGQPIAPLVTSAYYKTETKVAQAIEPFPVDLRIIAGSAKGGPAEVNGQRVWGILCPAGVLSRGSGGSAPTCRSDLMEVVLRFPDCWDGVHLDSPDHKSHMAYSRRTSPTGARLCPPSHPRVMPSLELAVRYPTAGGPEVSLASGAMNTSHADFVNGWDHQLQSALVQRCLRTDKYCGGGDTPVPGH